jgi:endonuclease I
MTTLSRLLLLLLPGLLSLHLLAQPRAGYYDDAAGLGGEALQQALHNIIDGHTVATNTALWTHFQTTDAKTNGKVWDMYSDVPEGTLPYEYTFVDDQCGTYGQEGDCYNREHAFPTSWFGDLSPMNTDLFQLYPTDGYVNGQRANYPFGEVNSPAWTSQNNSKRGNNSTTGYAGVVFEPIDAYKGDFARTMFYMATRYYGEDAGWPGSDMTDGAQLLPWAQELMMAWHDTDPVSQKEIDRNNAVYGIQNNRNPFIDHPEYVDYIWGEGLADEPENHVTGFSANTITLNWSDATGPVYPDAYLVRMSASGFEAIADPTDGTPVDDDFWNKNVSYGKQTVTFGGLTPGQTYYFKIFGYTGSGGSIAYKTDGTIQQVSIQSK